MKNSLLLFLLFSLTLFSYCDSDDAQPECEPASPYENCCGTAPLEVVLGTGEMFVPNIFTPNGDGVNDFWLPYTNNGITFIKSLIVKDELGQEIFQKFDLMAGAALNIGDGWDGTDGQGNILNGLFGFEITISNIDNQEATFTGKICCINCQEGNVNSENIDNCGFGSQHNGEGNLDLNIQNNEADCF